MSIKANVWQRFDGGWSTDPKLGLPNSAAYIQAFDFRKNPSQLSVLPGPTREDGGALKDLVVSEIMAPNGVIYAYGNQGYLYKRTSSGVWTIEGKTDAGSAGMDYRYDSDSLYLTSGKTVSLYNPVIGTGTPALTPNKYADSVSTYNNSVNAGFNVNADQENGTETISIQTAITETPTNKRFFQTDIEPLSKVSLFVYIAGAGNWTVTVHDGLNNVLGSSTISSGNMKSNDWNDFTFTTPIRIYASPNARTYHIHVTSTASLGVVAGTANNDLSSCNLKIWASRLVQPTNTLHPMTRFLQYECIGNANYVSVWEPLTEPPTNAEWQRHRLVVPMEYECTGLASTNEFLVASFEKVSTDPNSTPQAGLIIFWDGTSDTYNYDVMVPEGSPYSLHTYKNVAYYYAGGAWWALSAPNTLPVKLRTMPGSDAEFSAVLPQTTTGASGNYLTSTLSDDFTGGGINPTKWDQFGNVAVTANQLVLSTNTASGSHGVSSHNTSYDLTGSYMQIQLISVGNQALTSFEVYPVMAIKDANNQLFWYVNQGTIKAYKRVGGVNTSLASATYSATSYNYLRIREASGTIYWDYSADGSRWNNFASLANPFVITTVYAQVDVGNFNNEASTTSGTFDNFNVLVPTGYVSIFPNAATVRRGVHLMGYPSTGSSTAVNYGVYSWGAVDKNYPESFGYNYILSTGAQNYTTSNNLQIGMVQAYGDLLHISWRDDEHGGYGVDVVNNASQPATTAIWQSLITDNGFASKPKTAGYMAAYFDMPTGSTIQLAYKLDRESSWHTSGSYSIASPWNGGTLGTNYARLTVDSGQNGRYYEAQVQVTVTSTTSTLTPPYVRSVVWVYDDGKEELLI